MGTPAPGPPGAQPPTTPPPRTPELKAGSVDPGAAVVRPAGARAAKLTASRLHMRSLLKLSFLISVGAATVWVASIAALWFVLRSSGAFTAAQAGIDTALGSTNPPHLMDYLAFSQVISVATALGVIGALLAAALATLAGLAYNAVAKLVGGLQFGLRRQG